MPRFSLKSMAIVFVGASLWLSTAAGYAAASDVRRSILFLVLVASGCAAIYLRGKQRAFWAGFFASMLICGQETSLSRYTPNFSWVSAYAFNFMNPATPPPVSYYSPTPPIAYPSAGSATPSAPVPVPVPVQPYAAPYAYTVATPSTGLPLLFSAIVAGWILLLSLVSGFVATIVYDFSGTAAQGNTPS